MHSAYLYPCGGQGISAAMVLQVCRLLKAAHCPELPSLQGLCEIAIYIEGIFEESEPVHFFTGVAADLPHSSTNAAPVLDAIGQLASSGVFPALKKVIPLHICFHHGLQRVAGHPSIHSCYPGPFLVLPYKVTALLFSWMLWHPLPVCAF